MNFYIGGLKTSSRGKRRDANSTRKGNSIERGKLNRERNNN